MGQKNQCHWQKENRQKWRRLNEEMKKIKINSFAVPTNSLSWLSSLYRRKYFFCNFCNLKHKFMVLWIISWSSVFFLPTVKPSQCSISYFFYFFFIFYVFLLCFIELWPAHRVRQGILKDWKHRHKQYTNLQSWSIPRELVVE